MPLSVIIADDHPIFLQGLASLIQGSDEFILAGEANNGDDAIALIQTYEPDVAICDVSMPPFGAEQIAKFVETNELLTLIIALTVHEEPPVVRRVLDAGVAGYVLKISAFDDLCSAICSVTSGKKFISPVVAGILFDQKEIQLSNRERQILSAFATGLAYKQIASRLAISTKTVETYRSRLMKKLSATTTTDLVRYAIENGLDQ